MEKNIGAKNIFDKENLQQYLYLSLFFLIASFFVFFVIRPNIKQIFLAKQKLAELKQTDQYYNQVLEKIIGFQNNLEQNRKDLPIIDETIANLPQINKMVGEIEQGVKNSNLTLTALTVENISLKETKKKNEIKSLVVKMGVSGSFENLMNFFNFLTQQRKIKVIDRFSIGKEESTMVSSPTAGLKIELQISSFYL